ncbi:MAG TPA: MlaE family lipid ABC transporter permease subunit [Syntrophorhabdaceae bacterium]|nr:MlaE family lipid ABC transporter permease subunit [Syntrophorhabdaceae bacterium]HPU29914.1 MlaE family lipid ABC transporter permease subunit [Syntrophorhabdaceae bacterium]
MSSNDFGFDIKGLAEAGLTVSLSGRLSVENFDKMLSFRGDIFSKYKPSSLVIDLKDVTYMDSAGALFLIEMEYESKKEGIPCEITNMTKEQRGLLELIDRDAYEKSFQVTKKAGLNFIEQIGHEFIKFLDDIKNIITFIGMMIIKIISSLFRLSSIRWNDVLTYMKKSGVDGLPIVGLISFLLGLIMAFMSSLQLKQFGANIYVPALVSIAMIKELGPIMTAIIVAGRTGSAFAAEIGTMKVNEEVDALIVMGFDPIKFLAVPRVFAVMFIMPFLTIFSDLFAIFGGFVVGVLGLDLTVHTYIQQTMKAIKIFDIITSLIKSVTFAVLIAGIGCHRGFEVKHSAEEVGTATTSAVVTALFIIILVDSMFAVVLSYI